MRENAKGALIAILCAFATIFILVGGGVILNDKINKRIKSVREELRYYSEDLTCLKEMVALSYSDRLDAKEHHIICLGNSITIHEPKDSIFWYSNHGMAASTAENDYCHILERKLKELNINSTVTPVNIAKWERDLSYDLDTILYTMCSGKDVIVIRLGENIQDENAFLSALEDLVKKCMDYTQNIVLTGQYWRNTKRERVIINVARKYNLRYVPLDWIMANYNEECCPHEGDTIYDENGNAYPIRGSFIITHPNDFGMELIANSIYNVL